MNLGERGFGTYWHFLALVGTLGSERMETSAAKVEHGTEFEEASSLGASR